MLNPLIALTSLGLIATPALAQTDARTNPVAPTVRVSVADLDLARPSDRKRLDRRIAAAVERVCPPLAQPGTFMKSKLAVRCQAETTARVELQRSAAVARASASTVTASSR
jgi:UrcA family protein